MFQTLNLFEFPSERNIVMEWFKIVRSPLVNIKPTEVMIKFEAFYKLRPEDIDSYAEAAFGVPTPLSEHDRMVLSQAIVSNFYPQVDNIYFVYDPSVVTNERAKSLAFLVRDHLLAKMKRKDLFDADIMLSINFI